MIVGQWVGPLLQIAPGLELLVEGDAGRVDMEERESGMSDAFDQDIPYHFGIAGKESRNKGRTV